MINEQKIKQQKVVRRLARARSKVRGTAARPRLTVFRSAKHLSLQLIDDTDGKTLVFASDAEMKAKGKPVAVAKEVGLLLAKKAAEKKVKTVVFDRGIYQYHGRVQAAADGAREGGLSF